MFAHCVCDFAGFGKSILAISAAHTDFVFIVVQRRYKSMHVDSICLKIKGADKFTVLGSLILQDLLLRYNLVTA